jgi:hypothetical protein
MVSQMNLSATEFRVCPSFISMCMSYSVVSLYPTASRLSNQVTICQQNELGDRRQGCCFPCFPCFPCKPCKPYKPCTPRDRAVWTYPPLFCNHCFPHLSTTGLEQSLIVIGRPGPWSLQLPTRPCSHRDFPPNSSKIPFRSNLV